MLSNRKIHHYALGFLVLFFLLTYLLPLGMRPMIRPDEFRYAEIPREMLQSGDWISPHLNGVRYFEKPALGYQLTAASFSVFGENTFALRLPSAIATLLSAAFLYYLVSRKSRDSFLPGLATGIYLTFGIVFGIGTFAVLDGQLTAALTICIGSVYLACESKYRTAVIGWLILAGFAAGCAFLLKGFLAFAVPAVVLGGYLLWQKEWKKLLIYPWIPLIVAVAVALPWSLAIHQAEPDFWRYFFIEEHWYRFTSSTYDRKPQPFWYFLPILLGGVMPAGLLAIPAASGIRKAWLKQPFVRFLLCWFILPFLLFSASSCKLGTYILPCFPPLAILLALALRRVMLTRQYLYRKVTGWMTAILGWILLPGAIVTAISLIVWHFIPKLPRLYDGFPVWPCVGLIFAGAFGLLLLRLKWFSPLKGLAILLIGLIPLIFCGVNSLPTAALGDKTTEIGLEKCFQVFPPAQGDLVLIDRSLMAAACWVLKRDDLVVLGKPGELEYGFKNYPEYAARHYPDEALPEFIKKHRNGNVFYITSRDLRRKPFPGNGPNAAIVSDHGVTVLKF